MGTLNLRVVLPCPKSGLRLARSASSVMVLYLARTMDRADQKRKSPSYRGFKSSSEVHSRTKRANRRSNTAPELALRKELHRIGLRFRLKTNHLPGRPDLIFPGARAAIFCDGDFWHGRDWETLRSALRRRANPDYWIAKIGYNRRRDAEVTQQLAETGWRVMRLWEGEIVSDPVQAARKVKRFVYPDADES